MSCSDRSLYKPVKRLRSAGSDLGAAATKRSDCVVNANHGIL